MVLVSTSSLLHLALRSCCSANPRFLIVKWLHGGKEAEAFCEPVDVAVVDLGDEMVSLGFVRRLKGAARVVGVAPHPKDAVIARAQNAGVRSIITAEDDSDCHLCLAIEAAAVNASYFPESIQEVAGSKGKAGKLTARETQALELLRLGKQRIEIAEGMKVTPKTVDKFLAAAVRKLGLCGMQSLREYLHG